MKHIEFAKSLKTFVENINAKPFEEYFEETIDGVHFIADFGNRPKSISLSFKQDENDILDEIDALLTSLILLTPKNPDFTQRFDDYDYIDYQAKTDTAYGELNIYLYFSIER